MSNKNLIELAKSYQQSGNLNEAISLYRKNVLLNYNNHLSHRLLAQALAENNELDEAVYEFEKAIEQNSATIESYLELGKVFYLQKKYDRAKYNYHLALKINPKFPEAYYELGRALVQQANYYAAIASFKKAIKFNPNHQSAYESLIDCLNQQNCFREAETYHSQWLELKNQSPENVKGEENNKSDNSNPTTINTSKLSFLALIRYHCEHHIEMYKLTQGNSSDFYHEEVVYHPMAEGKYLSCIASMRRSQLISTSQHNKLLADSVKRLTQCLQSSKSDKTLWGLNFKYKHLDQNEYYVITNSIILLGLLSNYVFTDSQVIISNIQAKLALELLNFDQHEIKHESQKFYVPAYCNNLNDIVYNSIAMWAKSLYLYQFIADKDISKDFHPIGNWIISKSHKNYGFPYSESNSRIDLLHNAYIIYSLLTLSSINSVESIAIKALSPFMYWDKLIDVIDIKNINSAKTTNYNFKSMRYVLDSDSGNLFYFMDKPARNWSLGESLLVSTLLASSKNAKKPEYWNSMCYYLANICLERLANINLNLNDSKQVFFRDSLHLTHGLLLYLELKRMSIVKEFP
ncbi:tetratricopeptide repeat protein [Limnospira sp. PMC 917.15]|uniref:tetratricopeptide repeat protein n=1 Tax=Limnospira sp. PMC 917.15 TaxID=2981106 RepID=UPI0028E1124F|nr:tetratricopeptide repeat protein [Limnospira sp. PMC 917.15]MDT9235077.1 tetratricopeptide repeat protein [Limnospira sp. PMC 917.15]